MTTPQLLVFLTLGATMGFFLWGRFRHDIVALAALMACVVAGLVPFDIAFAGFGHPAVWAPSSATPAVCPPER